MSQMPDKIWLHRDTKYNTEDIVTAYQYEFAQEIECEGIENFVEYVPVNTLINKACKWLKKNKDHPLIGCEDPCLSGYLTDKFIEEFKKAMEK